MSRMARRRNMRLGVWLAILAIAVNALLPIHLAKDIIHAANHLRLAELGIDAAATGSHHHHGHPGDHHHHDGGCLICGGLSAAAVTATTLPPLIVMATPSELALASPLAALRTLGESTAHTPYAPRAPPGAA